jgi:hypothetical protein
MRDAQSTRITRPACISMLLTIGVAHADAQTIGTFAWQYQPYCNVITISVTQVGATFRLDGFDDQCGAAARASVVGTAFPNPDGTIGLGLTSVATPGGAPVHVDATVTAPAFSGTWRDSAGNTGSFVFSPPIPAAGSPRPASGTIGAAVINPLQVQRRVTGECGAGSSVRVINEDGTVICQTDSSGTGDITGVTTGPGLTGGGATGTVALSVQFAESGTSSLVARSNHTHSDTTNTPSNTAVGDNALSVNLTQVDRSTGLGVEALTELGIGNDNTAVGYHALAAVDLSSDNTALGSFALSTLTQGSNNIAIGYLAGSSIANGSGNILIGNTGAGGTSNTTRIGAAQTAAYMAGIEGRSVDGGSDVPVLIDENNKLGTTTSSRRFKTDIESLTSDGRRLHDLRPVSFRYLPDQGRGQRRQFGLVAEEVAEVFPELVVSDALGQPFTVRYHQLPPLLLAEIQRLERERAAQDARIADQTQVLALQAARLDAQARELASLRALIEAAGLHRR